MIKELRTLQSSKARRTLCLAATLTLSLPLWAEGVKGLEQGTVVSQLAQQQREIKVSGTVVDAKTGEPILGASVRVRGTKKGALTDVDGKFSLSAPVNGMLDIAYTGYKSQAVAVSERLTVKLAEDSEMLQDVVVVGYGTQKKVNVTGSVASVDAKALEARPVNNVAQALQGVVPGLNLNTTNSGGALNAGMSMSIRGSGTIGTGSTASPLVLIDGAEGDMNTLNPNDIANISVLKDAASASIYGARGAFGVILITTKNGKTGKPQITYGNNFRFSTATQVPEMMNSVEFANFFNTAARNSGQGAIFSDEAISEIKQYYDWQQAGGVGTPPVPSMTINKVRNTFNMYSGARGNTNWFKEFYRPNAPSQDHNISVRGGSDKFNYSFSGSILSADGLLRVAKDHLTRYNLSGKIGMQLTDWARLEYATRWVKNSYERPAYMTGLFFHNIARRWPMNPVYDPNGNLVEHSEIQQLRAGTDMQEKETLHQAINLMLNPLKGWTINGQFTYATENTFNNWNVLPVYYNDVSGTPIVMSWDGRKAGETQVSESAYKNKHWTLNLYTDYTHILGDHTFSVKLGTNVEESLSRDLGVSRKDLVSPSVISINTARETTPGVSGGYGDWAVIGYFGRFNYSYADKYLFEANVRRDGSSRFIGDKRWGTFPSFSFGWNIAKENWFHNALSKISTLKLRASWGQLGNMNTQALYPFYQTMPLGQKGKWLVDGKETNTAGVPGIISTDLTWERVVSTNIGLDWAALDNRLTGSFDYFVRNTFDMIGPAPERSSILGTGVPRVNNADMRSFGWELELGWRDNIGGFKYGAKLVLSDDRQQITRYPNENKSLSNWYSGQITGDIWGYETIGIAKTDAEMDAHLATTKQTFGTKWAAGDVMYKDLNGDGKIDGGKGTLDDHGDWKVLGNSQPRYRFGVTLDAAYKGFDFRVFFQGVAKRDYVLGGPYFWGSTGNEWQSAGFKEHLNYFRPEGDPMGANLDAYYPRPLFGGAGKNQQTQSRYVQNAAYLRIKNIQLGYTLPEHLTQKIYLNRVRLYVSADNLITFTKISKIFDPEALGGDWGAGKLYPLSRVISFGATINL